MSLSQVERATQPAASKPPAPPIRIWLTYALAIVVYAAISRLWQAQPVPDNVFGSGVLVAAIALFPLALWRVRGSQGAPIFELICLSYGIQYAMPMFLLPNVIGLNVGFIQLGWDDTLSTELLAAAGIAAMIAAFYLGRRFAATLRVPRIHLLLDSEARRRYILFALGVGVGALTLQSLHFSPPTTSGLSSIFDLLVDQGYVGLALLAYSFYKGHLQGLGWRAVLYGAGTILIVLGLATTFLENALVPAVLLMIVSWNTKARFPLRWALAGLFVFVTLNAVKEEYRLQAGGSPSVSSRVTGWFDLAAQNLQQTVEADPGNGTLNIVQRAASRLDLLHIFTHVYATTPSQLPYYGGATYDYLLYAEVPRVLWPGKPEATISSGGAAQVYGLLNAGNTTTSIGLGQPAEAYANFGILGVLLIMALQGAVLALLDFLFNGPESEGGRAIYLAVMVFFLNGIGTGTAILFGAVLQKFLGDALLIKAFVRWGKRPVFFRHTSGLPRRIPAATTAPVEGVQ